jgi:hypothetical protein
MEPQDENVRTLIRQRRSKVHPAARGGTQRKLIERIPDNCRWRIIPVFTTFYRHLPTDNRG